jgi:hypothetical protein
MVHFYKASGYMYSDILQSQQNLSSSTIMKEAWLVLRLHPKFITMQLVSRIPEGDGQMEDNSTKFDCITHHSQ